MVQRGIHWSPVYTPYSDMWRSSQSVVVQDPALLHFQSCHVCAGTDCLRWEPEVKLRWKHWQSSVFSHSPPCCYRQVFPSIASLPSHSVDLGLRSASPKSQQHPPCPVNPPPPRLVSKIVSTSSSESHLSGWVGRWSILLKPSTQQRVAGVQQMKQNCPT